MCWHICSICKSMSFASNPTDMMTSSVLCQLDICLITELKSTSAFYNNQVILCQSSTFCIPVQRRNVFTMHSKWNLLANSIYFALCLMPCALFLFFLFYTVIGHGRDLLPGKLRSVRKIKMNIIIGHQSILPEKKEQHSRHSLVESSSCGVYNFISLI